MGPFSVFWIPVRNQNKKEKKNDKDVLDCVVKRRFFLERKRASPFQSFSFQLSIALRHQSHAVCACLYAKFEAHARQCFRIF